MSETKECPCILTGTDGTKDHRGSTVEVVLEGGEEYKELRVFACENHLPLYLDNGWKRVSEIVSAEAVRKLTEHKAACFDELLTCCKKVLGDVLESNGLHSLDTQTLLDLNAAIANAEKLP